MSLEWRKPVLTAAIVGAMATVASSTVAIQVMEQKLVSFEKRLERCEDACAKLLDDMYRPAWDRRAEDASDQPQR